MALKTVCHVLRLSFTILLWKTCCCLSAQGQTCNCTGGCGNNGTTLPGSDGRIENVAYGKLASMSSKYTNDGGSGPACAAVNGRTGTIWTPVTSPHINCVHTNLDDFDAWWQVDLGHNYTVADITIIRRKDWQRRMAGGSVYVDDQLCHSFPNSTNVTALDALPEQIKITCTPPLTGQVVRFQKHGQDEDWNYYFINICEVQVWACKPGLYGDQCNQTCSGHCKDNDTCDNYHGTCPRGCEPGWTSPSCDQSAGDDEGLFVIAGAAVAGLVVIAFATILSVCCVRRSRNRSSQQPATVNTMRSQDHVYENTDFNNSVEPAPQMLAPKNLPALFPFEEEEYYSSLRAKDDGSRTYTQLTLANRNIN